MRINSKISSAIRHKPGSGKIFITFTLALARLGRDFHCGRDNIGSNKTQGSRWDSPVANCVLTTAGRYYKWSTCQARWRCVRTAVRRRLLLPRGQRTTRRKELKTNSSRQVLPAPGSSILPTCQVKRHPSLGLAGVMWLMFSQHKYPTHTRARTHITLMDGQMGEHHLWQDPAWSLPSVLSKRITQNWLRNWKTLPCCLILNKLSMLHAGCFLELL